MKVLILILRVLKTLFGQNRLWSAFEKVAERKTIIKLKRFDERAEIRELKDDIKEINLKKRKEKKTRRRDERGRFIKNEN